MKKVSSLFAGFAGLVLVSFATPAFAAGEETITGNGACAKCSLHEADKCQNTVTVEKDGKKVVYYLDGAESKAFHKNICKADAKVTATGTVKEEGGKKVMMVSKIAEAK